MSLDDQLELTAMNGEESGLGAVSTLISSDKGLKNPISTDDAVEFLQNLWLYTSLEAQCYSIIAIGEEARFKHFCLEDYGDYPTLFSRLRRYLEKALPDWTSRGYHVYYQVLPLSQKPEKGRGTSRDVKVGQWLWIDKDYKETVGKPEFKNCREGRDHALECYYQDGDKWVHVKRPPLKDVLQEVEEKLGLKPTIVVDSGAGYHLYFKLSYEIDAARLQRLELELVEELGGDPQSKDLARILRLPGSVNPRVSRLVREIYYEPSNTVDPEELESRLLKNRNGREDKTLEEKSSGVKATGKHLRELSDSDLIKLKELVKKIYIPGHRQSVVLYLSGWLGWAGVHPISAVKLVKMLHEETGDEDPLKTRLSAVVYTYKKLYNEGVIPVDIDQYVDEIAQATGIKPYGLGREIRGERVGGKGELIEHLHESAGLSLEELTSVISEIEEILRKPPRTLDIMAYKVNHAKNTYIVNVIGKNKKQILRARKGNKGYVFEETIMEGAVSDVEVLINPLSGDPVYKIKIDTRHFGTLQLEGDLDIIVNEIRKYPLVVSERIGEQRLRSVLNAVMGAFLNRGLGRVRTEINADGFFLLEDKVMSTISWESPSKEELQDALMLLDELSKYFHKIIDVFAYMVKWGLIAPFNFARKQKSRTLALKFPTLYGERDTGKTTLSEIACIYIWGRKTRDHSLHFSDVNTEARLGYVVSTSTFPVVVNEAYPLFDPKLNPHLVNLIKSIQEGIVARSRFEGKTYKRVPALAPLVFTLNIEQDRPVDFAKSQLYPKTVTLLNTPLSARLTRGEKEKFEREVAPRLVQLQAIGRYAACRLLEKQELIFSENWASVSESLLREMYEYAGLTVPTWISLTPREKTFEDLIAERVEVIRTKMLNYINEAYAKYVGKDSESNDENNSEDSNIERKLRILVNKQIVPWIIRNKNSPDVIYITSNAIIELKLPVDDLPSLATLLGLRYVPSYKVRIGKNVTSYSVVETTIKQLADMLQATSET